MDPKPLDHIVNKRLRKYVSEINTLRFTIFHIAGAKKYLSGRDSQLPSVGAGDDSERVLKIQRSLTDQWATKVQSSHILQARIFRSTEGCMPLIAPSLHADCPQIVQIFDFNAFSPAFDADYMTKDIGNSDDYMSKAMSEVASMLSTSAGKQVSVAMTVEKLGAEIRFNTLYKYLRQTLAGNVQVVKYVGELDIYSYPKDNLTVSDSGLILYKGSRFLLPKVLRAGLLSEGFAYCAPMGVVNDLAGEGDILVAESKRGHCANQS